MNKLLVEQHSSFNASEVSFVAAAALQRLLKNLWISKAAISICISCQAQNVFT